MQAAYRKQTSVLRPRGSFCAPLSRSNTVFYGGNYTKHLIRECNLALWNTQVRSESKRVFGFRSPRYTWVLPAYHAVRSCTENPEVQNLSSIAISILYICISQNNVFLATLATNQICFCPSPFFEKKKRGGG